MALKNQALTVCYLCWDKINNIGKTGDASNHTLRLVGDGTEATPSGTITEVDATNLKGIYKITLSTSEMNSNFILLGGISSTPDIIIYPVSITTENVGVELSEDHGAGQWGAAQVYDNTITFVTQTSGAVSLPRVQITCKNDTGAGLQSVITNSNGNIVTTLPDGEDTVVLAWLTGYIFPATTVDIDGNQTITLTGTPIAIPVPEIGLQVVTFNVRHPNGNGYAEDAVIKAYIKDEFDVSDVTITNQITETTTNASGYGELQLIKSGIFLVEIFFEDERIRHKNIVVTSDNVKPFETYPDR